MSLIAVGRSHLADGMAGLQKAAELERGREMTEKSLDKADKARLVSNVSTGAGMGAMMGMQAGSIGGPAGALVGAGIGYMVDSLF